MHFIVELFNVLFAYFLLRFVVDIRRAAQWTRGFGSMSRAEMAFEGSGLSSGATNLIFGRRTQSYTADTGNWEA